MSDYDFIIFLSLADNPPQLRVEKFYVTPAATLLNIIIYFVS